MSGICAVVHFDGTPVDADVLRKMAQVVAYRGPDGIRYWGGGNVGLAHLALNATLESLRERQPSISAGVCLTADARVDNRDELICTLQTEGYLQEKDPTDADLILAAYSCWGEACPEHIIGDFAFAISDSRKHCLFCARDALGTKPLHYGRVGPVLCVASEAQQILQHPEIPCRLDEVAMADHLVSNCHDEERTMFLDVRRLPPGHRLIATSGGLRLERYWDIDPKAETVYRRDDDYAAHFLQVLQRAVADRLRTQAGVVGIAMSGGLDSCAVAAVAWQMLAKGSGLPQLVAYSWAFEQLADCDERDYSSAMAAELGLEIEYMDAESWWFLDDPVAFRPSLETPFLFEESRNGYMLSRLRARGARSLLTGHGGDRLLTGSPLIYADRLAAGKFGILWQLLRHARQVGAPLSRLLYRYYTWMARPLLVGFAGPALRRTMRRISGSGIPPWIGTDFARRTGLAERLARSPVQRRFPDLARQENYEGVGALGADRRAVYWWDRAAPRFGLEARHPILHRRLVEFVLSIPPEQTFRPGQKFTKLILRRALKGILPEAIRLRTDKAVFRSYLDFSLRDKAVKQVRGLLEAPVLADMGVVNPRVLRDSYDRFVTNAGFDKSYALWFTITLELWVRQYRGLFENLPHL